MVPQGEGKDSERYGSHFLRVNRVATSIAGTNIHTCVDLSLQANKKYRNEDKQYKDIVQRAPSHLH